MADPADPKPVTDLEPRALDALSVDRGWRLIERFASLERVSGTGDERRAAGLIAAELEELGIEHEVYEPSLYLSLPGEASVLAGEEEMAAKPPSFSASTRPDGLTAPAAHVPASRLEGGSPGDIFETLRRDDIPDVAGRIVVTEGYPMPLSVGRFEAAGAAGQVYINPGENIHWMICTPVWGTPTDHDLERTPRTPVVSISRPDGERLLERLAAAGEAGLELTIRSRLEEGWFECPLPVATIPGQREEFVLVHGHYDSWDVGVGDNAVGDATLLELARIFHARGGTMRRSLRIAWWPGHSTGRYAGSTWYADRFALELRRDCVAAVNVDSPGCWKATEYDAVMWMAEAEALCRDAIGDATGRAATGIRPVRAGDWSFDQIGLTSFFMLLSNIPEGERERLGFYPVGGCGGNIAWHTEDDTLDVADRDNLARDLRVYVTALARMLDAEILPLDFRATVRELQHAVTDYREEAGELLDLDDIEVELEELQDELEWLYAELRAGRREVEGLDADAVNRTLRELARHLVPVNYAEGELFDHDPALPRPPIPKLADVARLGRVADTEPELLPFVQARLRRRVNQVANAFFEAGEAVRRLRQGMA